MKTIDKMAEEAGMHIVRAGLLLRSGDTDGCTVEDLAHFAALVAERCAELAKQAPSSYLAARAIKAEFPKP